MTTRGIEGRARPASLWNSAKGAPGRAACVRSARPAAVLAAIGLALALPGCAAGSLNGLSAETQITTGKADVQMQLRAEAKRLVQPLPASRPGNEGGLSLGGMLDVLVNGMSEAEMAAQREAEESPGGPEAMAGRYLAARGGAGAPDLVAIETDLAEKSRNAARFATVARAVLTWHGQLRASFYRGELPDSQGAKLSALIERDKAVISRTYETLREQAAVLNEAVERVRGQMGPEQAQRVAALEKSLQTSVSQLGALSGQGLNSAGAVG
ncbi:MAG: hypothetical protein ACLFWF_09665 [Alphaproteobacteria bacterium]